MTPPRFADLVEATRGMSVAEAAAAWDRASQWATCAAIACYAGQFLAWSELARQVSAAHLAVAALRVPVRSTVGAGFWARVDVREPDECWPWRGGRDRHGYGKSVRWGKAHRMAYALANGAAATGMVLHSCDNPACCNPAHLRDGTAADNVRDMIERRRWRPRVGELNTRARLTWAEVAAIRARMAAGETAREVAADFGVHPRTISKIAAGERWSGGPNSQVKR